MSLFRSQIILQNISTIWTKASRGGSNASARNHPPEALELPELALLGPADGFLLHTVVYTEEDHFQHPIETWDLQGRTEPYWYDCLKLQLNQKTLRVTVE